MDNIQMNVLILCSGTALSLPEKNYDSAGFAVLSQPTADREFLTEGKKLNAGGRPVYVSTWMSARRTAEQLIDEAELLEEPLLDEVILRPYKDSSQKLPLWHWRLMAQVQRRIGNARQPESSAQTRVRAEKLIELLEAHGQDCILVSHPIFLKTLLDRFRAHGYVAARSEIFSIKPLERIVLTRRDMHCGGCQHNCLLSNPGCGVGRDKARRHSG